MAPAVLFRPHVAPFRDVRVKPDARRPGLPARLEKADVKAFPDTPDGRLAARAAATGGIVDFRDTDAAGLSRRAVSRRVAAGRLYRVHSGVFAVGHAGLDPRSRAVAALRAGGPEALLSHPSATALWDLTPWPAVPHITVPTHRRIEGVVVHQARKMPRPMLRQGLRTTTVPQALLDFAEVAREDEVLRALNEALYLRRTSAAAIERFLRCSPGRRGVAVLSALLPDAGALHSPLEDEFFALLRAARLPLPECNVRVARAPGRLLVAGGEAGRRDRRLGRARHPRPLRDRPRTRRRPARGDGSGR